MLNGYSRTSGSHRTGTEDRPTYGGRSRATGSRVHASAMAALDGTARTHPRGPRMPLYAVQLPLQMREATLIAAGSIHLSLRFSCSHRLHFRNDLSRGLIWMFHDVGRLIREFEVYQPSFL